MNGRISNLTFGRNGEQYLTVETKSDMRPLFDRLKDEEVTFDIKKFRQKRSLNANAYFHVLVNKIAEVLKTSDAEVKKYLVCSYGVYKKGSDLQTVGLKLPENADIDEIYPYTRLFDTREENGVLFHCYLLYKRTSEMDSAEMARLIDGTIYEAKELGIETDTPDEIARLKAMWKEDEA